MRISLTASGVPAPIAIAPQVCDIWMLHSGVPSNSEALAMRDGGPDHPITLFRGSGIDSLVQQACNAFDVAICGHHSHLLPLTNRIKAEERLPVCLCVQQIASLSLSLSLLLCVSVDARPSRHIFRPHLDGYHTITVTHT